MPTKLKLIAAAVLAAFLFWAGAAVNGWRLAGKHTRELAKRDNEALLMARQVIAIGNAVNAAISEADAKAWKGLEDDKKELGRLRGCVAAGTCGVRLINQYVQPEPDDPGAGSVGHDTVEIDTDVQRRVLDHREAINEDRAKIEYLQGYALACWRAIRTK